MLKKATDRLLTRAAQKCVGVRERWPNGLFQQPSGWPL
jgi:hypothetical protein